MMQSILLALIFIIIVTLTIKLIVGIISLINNKCCSSDKIVFENIIDPDNYSLVESILRNKLYNFTQKYGNAIINDASCLVQEKPIAVEHNAQYHFKDMQMTSYEGVVPELIVMPHSVALIHIIDGAGTLKIEEDNRFIKDENKYLDEFIPHEYFKIKKYIKENEAIIESSAEYPAISGYWYDKLTNNQTFHLYFVNSSITISNEMKNLINKWNEERPFIKIVPFTYDFDKLTEYESVLLETDYWYEKHGNSFDEDKIVDIVNRATLSEITNPYYTQQNL